MDAISPEMRHMLKHREVREALRMVLDLKVEDPDNPPHETVTFVCKGKVKSYTLGRA